MSHTHAHSGQIRLWFGLYVPFRFGPTLNSIQRFTSSFFFVVEMSLCTFADRPTCLFFILFLFQHLKIIAAMSTRRSHFTFSPFLRIRLCWLVVFSSLSCFLFCCCLFAGGRLHSMQEYLFFCLTYTSKGHLHCKIVGIVEHFVCSLEIDTHAYSATFCWKNAQVYVNVEIHTRI